MGLIGFAILLIGLGLVSGEETKVFDLSGLLYVISGTIGMLLCSGINAFSLLKIAFASNASSSELSTGARDWELLGIYALVSGAVVSLIRIVLILGNMEDPSALGTQIANCLITQGYGFSLAFFVSLPLRKKLAEAAGQPNSFHSDCQAT